MTGEIVFTPRRTLSPRTGSPKMGGSEEFSGVAARKQARLFYVEGRVQGVGFRFFVEDAARQLGVCGYVRNLYDGRVEVYAWGEEALLQRLRRRLEEGPAGSRVERVLEREAATKSYRSFSIEASGEPSL
jgi:acylphosphatase